MSGSSLSSGSAHIIERVHMVDLIHTIYRKEGWVRAEGESRTKRCQEFYVITSDAKRNRFVATRRGEVE